ncbi:xylose isomerase [Serratia sp. MYb239]|uniref:sugar phosphate isomerase/epimerase family protein n=1 Tax=Serratia sp. MYb239 TaxID=2033438 RepID=UPI000CF6DDE2|nr:xylose isomerase [Serratia sp. MYb239]AVJ15673.1 xylose isomerase [Serratia sp. MYb239]MBU3892858.1 sugar phosphate isomerase/epimerase [Serratia rubidaea]MCA4824359.1 sugar phosphate isomerase/epimerase [Serratia rubidaea]
MKREVIVVTGAYGTDTVQQRGGQAAMLPIIADAGADGVEIRRELFSPAELDNLPQLAQEIERQQLFTVYSAPEPLFTPDHHVNPKLPALLAEAQALKARRLKLSLGHYQPGFDFTELKVDLMQHPVQLVVENDQTADCGILSPMNAFLHAAEDSQLPISMTFDMANWLWVGQDPRAAAERLARHVGYIHVKAAVQGPRGWRAIALDDAGDEWRRLLAQLPADVPRGIEFPLQGDDLEAVTRHYVNLLRAE